MNNSENSQHLNRFWQLLRKYKSEVNSIYIYAIFNALISLSVPIGIQTIINLLQGAEISTSWVVIVVLVSLGVVATGFLLIMQQIISENIQQKIFVNSAFDFAYRIPKFKTESVDKEFIPELINRFFDTITIQKGITRIILDYSIALIQILVGLILLMFYHPFFISFGLALILIIFLILKYTFPIGLSSSIKESKYKYELVHWLENLGRSMKTFKLAGKTDLPLQKTDDILSEWIFYRKKHFKILIIQYIGIIGFKALITSGLLIIGGLLVINQQMNIGQFVAAEIIILMILVSIEKLLTGTETFFDILTSLKKLSEITDIPLETERTSTLDQIEQGVEIQIKNLSFRYSDSNKNMLDNINLTIRYGEKIGIAGYNGSGKTTLLEVIAGLHNDYSGAINFNGIPMRNLNMENLRGIVGDNLKDNILFEGTLLENITMGKSTIKISDIVEICELVDLNSFIESLPNGFETSILSEGKTLSNSIKLKIILARCLAEMPKLILIEDNFYLLDSSTQEKIKQHLFSNSINWSLVIATNNIDCLKMLDRIVVLDHGKIVAQGTYQELLKNDFAKKIFYSNQNE